MFKRIAFAAATAWALLASSPAALASQGNCVLPTTGTLSGLTLVQDANLCNEALMTNNSGATAPVNGTGGVALAYQLWLKTTDKSLNIYDSANWLPIGTIDSSGHIWQPVIGGGYYSAGLASATTTDLCSVAPSLIKITGTTTITSFSNTCQTGQMKALLFAGALSLTNNATSMILPNGGADIPTAAGDRAMAVYLGGGNWELLSYTKADGSALSASANFTGGVFFNSTISPTALGADTNDWSPTGLSTANVIRFSCSPAVNITGIVAPGTAGQTIVLHNIGATNACTLVTQSGSSTAANRFAIPISIPIAPGTTRTVVYDLTTARWRLFGAAPGTITQSVLDSGSGATYTTPQGTQYIRLRMVGGGGGGSGSAAGGNGTATTFGGLSANAGSGGTVGGNAPSAPAAQTGCVVNFAGGQGGASTTGVGAMPGGVGAASAFGGSGAAGVGGAAIAGQPGQSNSGAGGGGGGSNGSGNAGNGGNAGGYCESIIMNPAATYTYTIGAAGAAGAANANVAGGGTGGAGRAIVEAFP